jgi:flagellar biogenesis protein FliO
MWQRFGAMPGQQQQPASRSGISKYKLWIILGVIALVGIMTFQIINGLSSPSNVATNPSATAVTDSGSSDFLADGYDQLDGSDSSSSSLSFWGLWGGIVIPLLIVIACVYIVLRGLKYVNSRVASSASSTKHLESLDVLPLAQSGSIHLVRVGSRVLAVGASGQQMSLLAELETTQAEEIIAAHQEQAAQSAANRQHMLEPFRDLLQKRIGTPDNAAAEPFDAEVVPPPHPTPVAKKDAQTTMILPAVAPPADTATTSSTPDAPPAERLEALLDRLRPTQAPRQDNPITWSDGTQPFDVVSEVPAQRE